ncbi:MAG: hypothetical protein AAGC65_07855 [Mucilaginibacter sp.]|uniref:hypothetical protein n=1 Tax=Mucilaginibacter sp. TaxID=1882438 RepID=UPI0031A77AA4
MNRFLLTISLAFVICTSAFTQSKNVGLILLSTDDQNDANYDKAAHLFLASHLKQFAGFSLTDLQSQASSQIKDDIGNDKGQFDDAKVLADAKAKGINVLVVLYYSPTLQEIASISGGVKKVNYGCRMNYYFQIVNPTSGLIIASKQFYGSVGTAISTKEHYKTKDDAVKAAFESSTPADYNDTTTKNIDGYIRQVLTEL